MNDEITTAAETAEAFVGKTVTFAHAHLDEEGGIEWVALTFDDGSQVELSAHGMHTEGWLIVERGSRIRDIYKVAEPCTGSDPR